MATRMSGGGRAGISPVTLVIFILLFLAAMVVAFMMYTEKVKVEQDYAKIVASSAPLTLQLNNITKETDAIREFLDQHPNAEAVDQYFKDLDTRGIKVEPKNFSALNQDLDLWILRLTRAAADLDRRTTEAKLAAEGAEKARDDTKDAYQIQVQKKNSELAERTEFLNAGSSKKKELLDQYAKEKQDAINKYNNVRDDWELRKQKLIVQTDQMTRKNAVVRRDLRVLRPEPAMRPPAGHVVQSDQMTRKTVVSLCARDHVFPGLGLDVYYFNAKGERVVKAKLEIMTVLSDSSVCNVVEADERTPIVAGDNIGTRLLPIQPGQKFVIAGFIPPDSAYDEEKMKALIRLSGGEVQDSVGLYTDVLVLGETAPRGIGEMDKKIIDTVQDKARTGLEQAEMARELSIDTIDYESFIRSLQQ